MLVLAVALGSHACAGPGASPTTQAAPQIDFEETVYDFGVVDQGTKVAHAYAFKSAGGHNLNVDNVRPSCGCTAALSSARVLPPGATGTVDVVFDTADAAGNQRKTVTVYSNDPTQPVTTLTLTGQVMTDVVADPSRLYVGHLSRGQTAASSVHFTGNATIISVESTGQVIRPTLSAAGSSGGGTFLRVAIKEAAALGKFEEVLTVHTASARYPLVRVPVTGIVDGDVVVSPTQIDFGVTAPEVRVARVVGLRNRGNRPIRITATRVEPAVGAAIVTAAPGGKEFRVTVTLNAGLHPGKIAGVLIVETDCPEESRIELPFSGRVVEKPS